MSTTTCNHWHELMAMDALGKLDEPERATLHQHLVSCGDCQETMNQISVSARALSFANVSDGRFDADVPEELSRRVLATLDASVVQLRRRRIGSITLALGGLVAATLIALLVIVPTTTPTHLNQRSEALFGTSGAVASAQLTARTWGTTIELRERGLPGNAVYTVSMRTGAGVWWTAGTYHSVAGGPVDAVMACAVPMNLINGVRVTDSAGNLVLSSY